MMNSSMSALMSPDERAQLEWWLNQSQQAFLRAVDQVSPTRWVWKPAPKRWSIGELAEHVVLAESLMFGIVQGAVADGPNPHWETQTAGKTELLVRVMPSSQQGKAEAPDPTRPRHRLTSAQAVERFLAERERIGRLSPGPISRSRRTRVSIHFRRLGR